MHLKEYRIEELRITQEEFAEKIGISRSSLHRYETGKGRPGTTNEEKILAACDPNKVSEKDLRLSEIKHTSRHWMPKDKDQFMRDYVNKRYSLKKMAEVYSISPSTARRKLMAFHIVIRKPGPHSIY